MNRANNYRCEVGMPGIGYINLEYVIAGNRHVRYISANTNVDVYRGVEGYISSGRLAH